MNSIKRNTAFTASIILFGFILGVLATANLDMLFRQGAVAVSTAEAQDTPSHPAFDGKSFADIAEEVMPTVVTVYSEQVIKIQRPGMVFPDDEFLRRFFGIPNQRRNYEPQYDEFRQEGLGSGVIVSEEGYILTNNHVVANADDINVKIGEKTYPAEIVGTDEKTDLAVLKVKADEPLTAAVLGDSDKIRVGEWVLAIGHPFNLDHTVTAGILSAKGRNRIGITDYEDFLQTDAAINPGNSGGALVNTRGELIGINTAIASRTGSYNGVGFAIPSNMAKAVMDQLIEHGEVRRGYVGINIQDLTPDLADAMGLDVDEGVIITQVLPNLPGSKAGLESSDLVVAIDGKPVKNASELRNIIASTMPGSKIELEILRDGKKKNITVVLDNSPDSQSTEEGTPAHKPFDLGMKLEPAEASELSLYGYSKGLVVTEIDPQSPADRAGIAVGDIIFEVNRAEVGTASEFDKNVRKTPSGRPLLLLIGRNGGMMFVALNLEEK